MSAEIKINVADRKYFSTLRDGEYFVSGTELYLKIRQVSAVGLTSNAVCLSDGRLLRLNDLDLVYEAKNVKISCERGGA